MKTILLTMLTLFSFASWGQVEENIVTFEKIIKTQNQREYWVKNIHLKVDDEYFRIKDSEVNKKRICHNLGFKKARGSKVSYDANERVVSLGFNLNMMRELNIESDFILNVTCVK